jgi:predicted HTH transcriptional regulator
MSGTKYRVFLSSVQKELEVERVSIAGAVSSDRLRTSEQAGTEVPGSVEEKLTERQRAVVGWLASGETITNRGCQERLGISKVTATKDLSALVELGLAERIGRGRNVRYVYGGGNR